MPLFGIVRRCGSNLRLRKIQKKEKPSLNIGFFFFYKRRKSPEQHRTVAKPLPNYTEQMS